MPRIVNTSIPDYGSYDESLLSTRRDLKFIQKGAYVLQWEPGIVLDIILDDKHPIFNSTIENIIVPNDHPLDINGKVPVNTDKNYAEVGMALIRLCYSQEKQDKEHLIWAYPIEKEFSAYPLYNEVVGVIQYFDNDRFYYTNKINNKNFTNTSADFRFEQTYGQNVSNPDYKSADGTPIKVIGPQSKLDSSTNITDRPAFRGILGNYFWFNKNIRNLKRYEGDTVIESRFGQSIRFGAYDDVRVNDIGVYTDYKGEGKLNPFSNLQSGGGNPMILIRNRHRLIARSIDDKNKNEKNVGGYIIEDINTDGSSIHITSGLTVSKFRTTCFKSYFSKDSSEEQPHFSPPGSTKFIFPKLNGDQIVINSDRLILQSRAKETMHFSKKRYMIVTDSEYTVDAQDQIVLTTNQKTVLNSPAIYLGEYNNSNEPAILGQTCVDTLYDLCNWMLEHTHWYKHNHPPSGGPSPEYTQVPVDIKTLMDLRSEEHTSELQSH